MAQNRLWTSWLWLPWCNKRSQNIILARIDNTGTVSDNSLWGPQWLWLD